MGCSKRDACLETGTQNHSIIMTDVGGDGPDERDWKCGGSNGGGRHGGGQSDDGLGGGGEFPGKRQFGSFFPN